MLPQFGDVKSGFAGFGAVAAKALYASAAVEGGCWPAATHGRVWGEDDSAKTVRKKNKKKENGAQKKQLM